MVHLIQPVLAVRPGPNRAIVRTPSMESPSPFEMQYWLVDEGEVLRRESSLARAVAGLWGRNSPTAMVLKVQPVWNAQGRIEQLPAGTEQERA